MVYINNFRYGEISKKTAGRFDAEFYQQSCFSFRNMVSHPEGDASRRPPLKKIADVESDILALREMTISESLSYMIALGKEHFYIYRVTAGKLVSILNSDGKAGFPYPSPLNGENKIVLDEKKASEVRTAQYYKRMYFVHESFRPFFIDLLSDDRFSMSWMNVLLNQDAKSKFWFTPSKVSYIDESGKEVELTALENRLVYKKSDGTWWFDAEMKTDQYKYALSCPPVQASESYIHGFDSYPSDNLLTGTGDFPSVIAIVNDSLYLAATANNPHVFWKSRILGQSQFIEGYTADSLHDFVQFQVVATEKSSIVDELPTSFLTDSSGAYIYEQRNGSDAYFGKAGGVANGEEIDIYYRPYKYIFYTDREKQNIYTGPTYTRDGGNTWYSDASFTTQLFYSQIQVSQSTEQDEGWYTDAGFTIPYKWTDDSARPYRKKIKTYDLSNAEELIKKETVVTYTTTDSCAVRQELATGRQDRIISITSACGKIIICTTSSEFTLPSSFSAVTYRSAEHFSDHGSSSSRSTSGLVLDSSFFFIQRDNLVREFYMYEGFMMRNEVTALNHEILNGEIRQIATKNTPEPIIYFVMADGTMRICSYDKINSIQSFGRWDIAGSKTISRRVLSAMKAEENNKAKLIALIEETEGETARKWIGYFDEDEKTSFRDEGSLDYISEIETTYAEVYDDALWFGRAKKANRAIIRPYDTGYILTGGDERQLVRSNYRLGSEDYIVAILSNSLHDYTMRIRAYEDNPMDILAFGFDMTR